MERKGAGFDEIYDVHAVRVLVDDLRDCYAALGVVHALWRPIPGQFDDYIAMPKDNMYQCLHTAVIAPDGKPLEVQIRTHEMHRVSEVGIAAHWRYKEGGQADREYDAKLAWLRQLMDWQRDVSDATEFVEGVKLDIFQDQVFVFTPKGDVKDLPAGATPLDFAYRIHTDVGHSRIGAKVNNRLVPLDYKLKNGDIVEIVTTKSAARAVTRLAEHRPDRPRQGEDPASGSSASSATRTSSTAARRWTASCGGWPGRRSRRSGRSASPRWPSTTSYATVDDFFAAIGYGAISAQQVVTGWASSTTPTRSCCRRSRRRSPARTGGVRVKGVGDLMIALRRAAATRSRATRSSATSPAGGA